MKKIQFTNGTTINGASTFNAMQDNVEDVFNGETPMGSIVVEDIKCKNEFNINKVLESFYANYSIDGDNITIISAGAYANIRILVDVEMGKQYTLSAIGINTLDTPTNISVYKTNGSDRYIEQYGYGTTPNFNLTFTPTENQIIIMFYANPTTDANFNTVKYSNIQLEKGETSEYTPSKKFGYNDRESMGKIIVDDIECKNILPNNIQSQVRNGLTITRNDDGSITLNGTTTSGTYLDIYNNEQGIKLKGDYRFYLFGSSTLNNLQGTINGSNVIYIKFAETAESVVVNYSTETILTRIFTFISKGSSFDNVTLKYMITKGTNEESYVEHKEFNINEIKNKLENLHPSYRAYNELTHGFAYRNIGSNLVECNCYVNGLNISIGANSAVNLGTLPEGYRPPTVITTPTLVAQIGGAYITNGLYIIIENETGNVLLRNFTNTAYNLYSIYSPSIIFSVLPKTNATTVSLDEIN